jgi:hypothetical protein
VLVIFSRAIIGISLALALSFPAWASDLPDQVLTPGAIDPNITQQNIQSTVCVKGYTKTVRPPAYYTNKLKKRQMREYGCTDMNPTYYEDDHLITLSIGGVPDDPHNLWPESRNSEWNVDKKDRFEFVIYRMVCDPKITLCGSTAHDVDKLALGIQELCAWKSLSSYTWVSSCRLK